jgi:hypothetical protein
VGVSSRLEQATVALVALLADIPSTTVERNRDIPADFVTEATPVLVVMDGDDTDESPRFLSANTVEFDTQLILVGYVTANDFAGLGPASDALWLAAWKIVTANPRLGTDLTWNVVPGKRTRRVDLEESKPVAVFEMPVTLRLKTRASDPSIAA